MLQLTLTICMPAAIVWLWSAGPFLTRRETATGGTFQSDSVLVGYTPSKIISQTTPLTPGPALNSHVDTSAHIALAELDFGVRGCKMGSLL